MSYEKEAFLRDLIEQHRPQVERDPFAYGGDQYLIGCPACNGNQRQIVRLETDPVPHCRFWTRALRLGLVESTEDRRVK